MIHLLLGNAGGLAQDPQSNVFRARDGSLSVSGIEHPTKYEWDQETGALSIAGTGKMVQVHALKWGVEIGSPSLDVSAQQNPDQSYFLTEAHTKIRTVFVFDSKAAAAYEASTRKTVRKGPPPDQRFELDTETSDYKGSQTDGELALPNPLDAAGAVNGEGTRMVKNVKTPFNFTETFKLHGSSGDFSLDPKPGAGIHALRSGWVQGPVTFEGRREEWNLDTKFESLTKIENGKCDRVEIATDPEGETVTLKGHVAFDVEGAQGAMHFRDGDTVTIRLDPTLGIVSIKSSGSPLATSIPLQPIKQ